MDNKNLNPAEIKMIGLVDRYLQGRPEKGNTEAHLDEDTLTAFVEGSLAKRESEPVVSHLVGCSFCRHITAELIKLEAAFAEDDISAIEHKNEPTKVSEVLSGILSRLFGTNDGTVFAHEEKTEEDEDKETDKEA